MIFGIPPGVPSSVNLFWKDSGAVLEEGGISLVKEGKITRLMMDS